MPHAEDEMHYVISETARFRYRDTEHPVAAGDVIHVEACAEHRFVDITEDRSVLVPFAPAERG
jgi:mannose-6-phosphate isomerase-like protein (cupin superfamily)